jgi:DNA-binding beta-propeller fold protein YncE
VLRAISNSGHSWFDQAKAISSDGIHVWVSNYRGNAVTELSAATGTVIEQYAGRRPSDFGIDEPDAISSDGTNVWVANTNVGDESVAAIAAS